jgi:hypothetical protein
MRTGAADDALLVVLELGVALDVDPALAEFRDGGVDHLPVGAGVEALADEALGGGRGGAGGAGAARRASSRRVSAGAARRSSTGSAAAAITAACATCATTLPELISSSGLST